MAYSALVPPRQWAPLGSHWVRYEANVLGDNVPVRITIHPEPFALHLDEFVKGLTVQAGPPELFDQPEEDR